MILHGKWFIYCCKRNNTKIVPRGYHNYMKGVIKIQTYLMERKGNISIITVFENCTQKSRFLQRRIALDLWCKN